MILKDRNSYEFPINHFNCYCIVSCSYRRPTRLGLTVNKRIIQPALTVVARIFFHSIANPICEVIYIDEHTNRVEIFNSMQIFFPAF